MARLYPFLSLLLALAALHGTCGVEYEVENDTPNTLGGVRFDQDIGIPFTKNIMGIINQFIWNVFEQPTPGRPEGIADYMVLRAKLNGTGFALPAQGDRWDEGYEVTARFLEYCDSLIMTGFTAALNNKM
ncbi:hypothetical protein RJ639_010500 [Escallonia herrerae]|uniref:Uncharacterized protein n=1 Tax=Escallonia herrerae TaxID=1293975 RepID=A0AA88VN69_9ASTE|nr:hypothetical protein RJ639_010500 [Escallonia herrerae]